jgi:hypothetical protein
MVVELLVVRTDIAPNGRKVHGRVTPHNRIDELIQAAYRGPNHVVACARIPGLQVPRQGDEWEDEAQKGEHREQRVSEVSHKVREGSKEWVRGSKARCL